MICTILMNTAFAAAIVLPPQADRTERYAARELQHWIKEISGEEYPVVEDGSGTAPRIRLGRAQACKAFAKDVAALEGTDGFAVRRAGDDIHVFGAEPRGTLNGVFALLEENTDIIWARPQATVFSKVPRIEWRKTDMMSRPKSTLRQIGFTVTGYDRKNLSWFIRNRGNSIRGNGGRAFGEQVEDARLIRECGGHMFSEMIPAKKYFAEHPEYFAEINGVRRPKTSALCLTAKGLRETFQRELFARLDASGPLDAYIIGMEDSQDTCGCPACTAPIKADDGTLVKPGDPAFKPTQWFRFVNPIADAIKAKYGMPVPIYAYFYLVVPPRIRISDAIVPLYHPVPRDMRKGYDQPTGYGGGKETWESLMDGYQRMCKGSLRLREYYGCHGAYPYPFEYPIWDDARYWLARGRTELSTEFPTDKDDTEKRFKSSPSKVWDARAVNAWVMMRAWWDPSGDVEALRRRYFERAYRAAAPEIMKYHARTAELWRNRKEAASAASISDSIGRQCIVETGAEDELRALLETAAKKSDHPVTTELIRRARAVFEELCGSARRLSAAKCAKPPRTAADWSAAQPIDAFEVFGHKERSVPARTEVSLLHDGTTLYIRAVAHDAAPGDRITLHFATEPTGDGRIVTLPQAKAEKAGDFTVETSVPLADIGCTPGKEAVDRVYASFYRYCAKTKTHLTLRGMAPGNARFYTDITLER